jgi:NADPH-dependent F420 reductase
MKIAVLGGTGALGTGLARRFVLAGHDVTLGSRDGARAAAAAVDLRGTPGLVDLPATGALEGLENSAAAGAAEIVIVAVPWEAHASTLTACAAALAGRIVVDAVNPLGFDSRGAFPLAVAEGSAAQQAEQLLPDSRVTAAFHHLPAGVLADPAVATIDSDTFVLGEDRDAVDTVLTLACSIPGLRAWYGGRLRNAATVEGLTSVIIALNRRHHVHAGLRVTEL